MKKLFLSVLVLGSAAAAVAAPVTGNGGNFTGAAVEIGAGATKTDFKNRNLNEKNKGDIAVRGSYNTEYGNNWIGGGEVAVKPLHRKAGTTARGDVKQKFGTSASYVHGYRIADDVLAYGKVGYHYGRFKEAGNKTQGMNGVGYGAGLKYAVTPNVEVGGEWEQVRFKKDDAKAKNNSYTATVGYRF